MAAMVVFTLVLCSILAIAHGSVQCIDSRGKPVDWFIVYKLPRLEDSVHAAVRAGLGFYYMDENAQYWVLSDVPVNATGGHALWYTLQQTYAKANAEDWAGQGEKDTPLFYALYNDQRPDGNVSFTRGHTKGALTFDADSGFWMVHSVPHFPPARADGFAYPHSGQKYGQTLMCVSYATDQLNEIGKQLLYNYPWVYDWSLPESMEAANPDLTLVLHSKHPTAAPWSRVATLKSLSGQEFLSFAKFSKFDADLYDRLVAPYLKSPLMVESWQNGRNKTASNCSTLFEVMNIKELSMNGMDFNETHDHSKWCVTTDLDVFQSGRTWICIGDINRADTQKERAGGTVCSILPDAWLAFQRAIVRIERCLSRGQAASAYRRQYTAAIRNKTHKAGSVKKHAEEGKIENL